MFNVTIKIESIESRRRSSGLLHIVVGFFLIMKTADYSKVINYSSFLPLVPFLVVGLVSIFYGFFRKRFDITYRYNYWVRWLQLIAVAVLALLITTAAPSFGNFAIFVFLLLCALLVFSERRIFHETLMVINADGIKIPGEYRDHFLPWHDLSEVVVREDFITLFHVKQKYLQFQVMQDLSVLEVAKMNAYCKDKIGSLQEVADNPIN
jgi:hypothetical protein